MINDSFRYQHGQLYCDDVVLETIAAQIGTPSYVYSIPRLLGNLRRLQAAFPDAHIHYSAKANANLYLLQSLIHAGAGIDAVSGGEIYRALRAGARADQIVFAGVGKTPQELYFALDQGVGWFNVENEEELTILNTSAEVASQRARIALRFNPDVSAQTHRHIATGHGGAKFGMTHDQIVAILGRRGDYPQLDFAGIHIHIGSQLHDTDATCEAVARAAAIARRYDLPTLDIGGGFPVAYTAADAALPSVEDFARAILPLVSGFDLILEPGRSIVADAGVLLTRVLYVKSQGGQTFVITDAGMTELIRPALYEAIHAIIPLVEPALDAAITPVEVVGPVCETTDVLGHAVPLPPVQAGDLLAILTAGAYGMVMASNYNARPRPAEVAVADDGAMWYLVRRRETWQDLIAAELR